LTPFDSLQPPPTASILLDTLSTASTASPSAGMHHCYSIISIVRLTLLPHRLVADVRPLLSWHVPHPFNCRHQQLQASRSKLVMTSEVRRKE
jgi:hypothetical protein